MTARSTGNSSQLPPPFGGNTLMVGMCIRDISELIGGDLRFGPMPPLDGALRPVERILPMCRNAGRHDVVLWHPQGTHREHDPFLEEAYARGALGVIASRVVAPWPGCFSLKIDDPGEALRRLARWRSRRFEGRRVVLFDPLVPSPACAMLEEVTEYSLDDVHSATGDDNNADTSVYWQVAAYDGRRDCGLLHITCPPTLTTWTKICRPEIVVISRDTSFGAQVAVDQPHARQETMAELVLALPRSATVVLPGDSALWAGVAARMRARPVTYGRAPHNNLVGEYADSTTTQLVAISGVRVGMNDRWRGAEESMLLAFATGHALGLSGEETLARLARPHLAGEKKETHIRLAS